MPLISDTQNNMTQPGMGMQQSSAPAPQIQPSDPLPGAMQTAYGVEGATTEQGPPGGQQPIIRGEPTSPALQEFYPGGVPATVAAQASAPVEATRSGVTEATAAQVGTPGVAQADQAQAGVVTGGPTEMSAAQQLADITSQDSPTMARARQVGKQIAGRRGLLSSTIAGQQAMGAMVDRALPLAQQDAATATALAQSAADRETQVSSLNAQLGTDVSKFNAAQLNEAEALAAQMQTAVNQGNAEAYNRAQQQFADLQTRADLTSADQSFRASQQFAQERNAMISATQAQIQELNKQFLAGSQAIDLAQIQGQYNTLISKNEAAARVFDSYLSGMSQIMSNKDISPSRVAQYVQTQLRQVQGSLDFIQNMDNTDFEFAVPDLNRTGGIKPPKDQADTKKDEKTPQQLMLDRIRNQNDRCCFTPDTLVTMADGSSKQISDIEVGDVVLGMGGVQNTVTGIEVPDLGSRELYAFNDGKPFVTAEHPFMTSTGWKSIDVEAAALEHEVKCELLREGDCIERLGDPLYQLEKIEPNWADPETKVYNLMLSGNHTYYANEMLVHNKRGDGPGPGRGGDGPGGDGPGGSGKVICTALNKAYGLNPIYGYIWMKHDRTVGNGDLAELGYHKLFYPLAKRLKSHPRVARVMRHIVKVRTDRLRREMKGKPLTLQQRVYKAILRPPCVAVGWLISKGILEKTDVRG